MDLTVVQNFINQKPAEVIKSMKPFVKYGCHESNGVLLRVLISRKCRCLNDLSGTYIFGSERKAILERF